MTGVEKPFVATYELEPDVDLPGTGGGSAQFFYPGGMDSASIVIGSSDLLVKIMPMDAEPWLANFSGDDYPCTTITTCPDPDTFCAVAHGLGYLVKANDPRNWSKVRALPILEVFPDQDHDLLLFADFTRIAAYGVAGLAWRADLVLDGLKILARNGNELKIRGDTYYPGSEEKLAINVLTGEIIELPCGHRQWESVSKPYPGRRCLICGELRLNAG